MKKLGQAFAGLPFLFGGAPGVGWVALTLSGRSGAGADAS
jgi:hypothetical protein